MIYFDEDPLALINPSDHISKREDCPKTIVSCFPHNLITSAIKTYHAEVFTYLHTSNGKKPLYILQVKDKTIGLFMSAVGASSAVGEYEELFALGVENIVVFGTCGVLDSSIGDCAIIIPELAYRDEGTSYHYAPGSDTIEVNTHTKDEMLSYFEDLHITHHVGNVWTTDGFYRETRGKVDSMKSQGFHCVDMECSAFAALAQFRKKTIAQFFYSADRLDKETWDKNSLANEACLDQKKGIMDIAIELAHHIHLKF